MQKLEDAIRELIKNKYGSVTRFAERINVPTTSVYSALERGLRNTRTELTDKIYRELNIDWETAKLGDDFTGLKLKENKTSFIDVPIFGSIAAGTPLDMVPVDNYHQIPAVMHERYPNAFLLKIEGESMNKILPNGCYALVDPCENTDCNGAPYAVCVNGYAATVKRVKQLNNGFELVPDSNDPTFTSVTYNYNEEGTEEITVIGRVVYYVLPYDWTF